MLLLIDGNYTKLTPPPLFFESFVLHCLGMLNHDLIYLNSFAVDNRLLLAV